MNPVLISAVLAAIITLEPNKVWEAVAVFALGCAVQIWRDT